MYTITVAIRKLQGNRHAGCQLYYRCTCMIGAMMFLKGLWKRPGVWNVEEFDPDPFMEQLNKQGLPWHEVLDGDLEL